MKNVEIKKEVTAFTNKDGSIGERLMFVLWIGGSRISWHATEDNAFLALTESGWSTNCVLRRY